MLKNLGRLTCKPVNLVNLFTNSTAFLYPTLAAQERRTLKGSLHQK